jgi:hypothetical protein
MKTQIIALESHDDLVSVRDRMSWAKSRRMLLVWPRFENVELRPVDLRMLQQHARYLGAELGLVTRRGDIRREAEEFGIPVFRSPAEAQRRAWPSVPLPARRRRIEGSAGAESLRAMRDEVRAKAGGRKTGVAVRFGSFAIGVLAVLALAALFVPRATIVLTPISQEQEVTLPVRAGPGIQEVAISGSVPAHVISVTVGGTKSAQVTSTAPIPQDKALGIAEFKNLTQTELVIPAGTIVYSVTPSSARFATQGEARLPGDVNATINVPIEAVQAGAGGNMPANSIQAVEGALGTSTAVTNPDPTIGGSDRNTTVPSADDRARVRQALVAQLQSQATDKLSGMIGAKDVLLPNTLRAGQVQKETYDPAAGDPGTLLNLSMSMEFQAQYIKADDLKTLAEAALGAAAPAGYVPSPESLSFSLGDTPVVDQSGASQFDLQVKCKLVHVLDLDRAVALVRGAPPSVAGALLRSRFPLDRPPEIRLSPAWWPWLPLIPFRITVTTA